MTFARGPVAGLHIASGLVQGLLILAQLIGRDFTLIGLGAEIFVEVLNALCAERGGRIFLALDLGSVLFRLCGGLFISSGFGSQAFGLLRDHGVKFAPVASFICCRFGQGQLVIGRIFQLGLEFGQGDAGRLVGGIGLGLAVGALRDGAGLLEIGRRSRPAGPAGVSEPVSGISPSGRLNLAWLFVVTFPALAWRWKAAMCSRICSTSRARLPVSRLVSAVLALCRRVCSATTAL